MEVGAHANAHQEDTSTSAAPSSPQASRREPNRMEQHRDLPPKITSQELDQTIDELRAVGGVHLLPIMIAVGLRHRIRANTSGRRHCSFLLDKPTIILLATTLRKPKVHPLSRRIVRSVLGNVSRVIIIACDAQPRFYALAATRAAMDRQHVLIIETRPQHEGDWCALIHRALQHTYTNALQ